MISTRALVVSTRHPCMITRAYRSAHPFARLRRTLSRADEGIFTPVFRGSPWDVSKPHNYVLFEWNTYLSAMIAVGLHGRTPSADVLLDWMSSLSDASICLPSEDVILVPESNKVMVVGTNSQRPLNLFVTYRRFLFGAILVQIHTDPWVAKSNVIRMTKSLLSYGGGYVAGFWNGLCGEVDKSKPPVGGLVLSHLVTADPEANLWVADLLIDQHLLWNRWWQTGCTAGWWRPEAPGPCFPPRCRATRSPTCTPRCARLASEPVPLNLSHALYCRTLSVMPQIMKYISV